jgi:hypothetical protein
MQIIYGAPFVLISAIAFVVCALVPRWQRYRFQALVAPVAFGFCSILAMGAIVLTVDHFNLGLLSEPPSGLRTAVEMLLIYFIPGLLGSWSAVVVGSKIANHHNG